MTNLTHRLGSMPVLTGEGSKLPLASTWAERPTVLVLVRHFG